jgi:hypothetical protein
VKLLMGLVLIALNAGAMMGCKAQGNSSANSNESTTTTFQTPSDTPDLQIAAIGGQGDATELLIGKFTNDVYPDIVELTSSGAYFYKNDGGSGWIAPVQIPDTAVQPYTVGFAADLDGDAHSTLDLVLATTSGSKQLIFLKNDGSGTFTQQASTLPIAGDIVTSLRFLPKVSNASLGFIVAAASAGGHFTSQISTALTFGARTALVSTIAPSDGIKILTGDLNDDSYTDFILVPSLGTEDVEVFKNTTDSSVASVTTVARAATTNILDSSLVNLAGSTLSDLVLATTAGIELHTNTHDASHAFRFEASTTLTPSTLDVVAKSFVAADFTMDTLKDFFFVRNSGGTSLFYSQSAALSFTDTTSNAFGSGLTAGPIKTYQIDVDGNGVPDLIELYLTGKITLHYNDALPD